MADDNKTKSVFYGVMQALRGPKDPARDAQQPKDLLMGSPAPGMEDVDFIQQKQQQYLDLQSVKIAQDLYSRTLFYDTDRITAYNDFRSMDMTPEIAAALDIISDEVCTRNERGNVISIYSDNLRIKKILQELFYRTLNAEFNLSFWTRELCKYGDCFLKLELDQNEGIYDCMMLPVGEIHKEIGYDGNPKSTRYKWDINNMFFEEWQVSHFCLLFDAARIPYGRSLLDPARKLWKQLQLAEDAMLVYRLTRAPERRIFYIEVGNTDPNDVYQLIESVKKSVKKSTVVDPNSGRVNLKYNPITYEEDYFLPVRGEKSSKIETLPGACLSLDTKIELLDGRSLELSEIIKEYENGKQLWSYSINPKTGEVVPGKITWAGVTRKNTDVVKITLDNGETITTTPDHKFPTRFNGIKQAKDLEVGESMWAFNKKFEKIKGAGKKRKRNTYEMLFDHKKNSWIYTHRMVANFFKDLNEQEEFLFLEKYRSEDKNTIHHKDFNRYNNSPENLCFMNPKDHFYYHQNNVEELHKFFGPEKVEEWKEMRKDGLRKYFSNLSEEELIMKANIARENSINSRQKSVSTFKKNPNRNEIIRENSLKSKSTKNKPENKIRYGINSKELWRNKEYVESVIGPQRIVYDEKMLSILSDFIKNGVDKTKDILPIINQPEHEFHKLFFGANASNQQLKKSNGITHNNLDKLVKHYGYNNWRSFKKTAECFNHKIVSIEYLSEKQDTGTITIDGPEQYHNFHNFALSVGIFTQNSNLDQIADIEYLQNKLFAAIKVPKTYLNYAESMPGGSTLSQVDLRFSRTINRIQEQIVLELRRIANVHLYFLGFEDDLDNFTITLTNPSTQLELLKLETWKARMEVFKELFSSEVTSPVSYSWAMEYILGFSKSEIKQIIRQKKVEKKMFSEIERANDEYMDTGIFKELDEKFRKVDFTPDGAPAGGGEAAGGEEAGGGEGFQGSSVLGGLGGGGGMEMPAAGGAEAGAPEAAPEAPAGGEEAPPITENRLIAENRKFDIQTRKLMKSIDSYLAKIKNESDGSPDDNKEIL